MNDHKYHICVNRHEVDSNVHTKYEDVIAFAVVAAAAADKKIDPM